MKWVHQVFMLGLKGIAALNRRESLLQLYFTFYYRSIVHRYAHPPRPPPPPQGPSSLGFAELLGPRLGFGLQCSVLGFMFHFQVSGSRSLVRVWLMLTVCCSLIWFNFSSSLILLLTHILHAPHHHPRVLRRSASPISSDSVWGLGFAYGLGFGLHVSSLEVKVSG